VSTAGHPAYNANPPDAEELTEVYLLQLYNRRIIVTVFLFIYSAWFCIFVVLFLMQEFEFYSFHFSLFSL
jgi:hypothetical protein